MTSEATLPRRRNRWMAFALVQTGCVLFLASLPLYVSSTSRAILGRWSVAYAAWMAACLLVWVIGTVGIIRSSRRRAGRAAAAHDWRVIPGLAIALWGLSYLLESLQSCESAGRILTGNLIGTATLPSLLIDWLAAAILLVWAGHQVIGRLPGRLTNAAVSVAALAAVLMVSEGILRAAAAVAPQSTSLPSLSLERWERRHVVVNSLGYRDAEHPVKAPRGVRRLLLVGDSFTWGTGVSDPSDRLGERVAARLSSARGEPWTAINAGKPDTHTLDHIAALEAMKAHDPDVVLLVYVFNDMDYAVRTPTTRRATVFSTETAARRFSPVRLLYLNSYLFQWAFQSWRRVRYVLGWNQPVADPYLDDEAVSGHIGDIARFVASAGSSSGREREVLVVPFDHHVAGNQDLQHRYRKFLGLLKGQGIPVCSLQDAFASLRLRDLEVNLLDGHPNETANRLAAAAVVDCLAADHGIAG